MALTKYTYSVNSNFPNSKVDPGRLTSEIQSSSITHALHSISVINDDCNITFNDELLSEESTALGIILTNHSGEPLPEIDPSPRMPDGRPIVRADTRPLNTMTVFTSSGDDSTSIGGGVMLKWDFSNSDDEYTGPEVQAGFKCKQILISFHCPVYMKDGTMYFFKAPWGAAVQMSIAVPPGQYYPNPKGSIPAAALGLVDDDRMFSNSGSDIVPIQVYVNNHPMYGDCPMGDEFNAEGCAIDALPAGWYVRALIFCPEANTEFKGYGDIELYRCHTCLLPGQTIADIIAEH